MTADMGVIGGPDDQRAEKLEELSIPAGWVWAPLGSLGFWIGGGTPSKSVAAYWANGTIPWVSPKDMKTELIRDTEDRVTEAAVKGSAAKFVPPGSVLMVVRSGILRHTFPVAVNQERVTVNQDLRALVPGCGIDPQYVAHYLHAIQGKVLHDCSKDGTTVQSIEVSALERMMVPIAPTAEQRRIVARIDELFAEISEGEAALERARQGLDTWRRALLKAAVTGELTRDWREANHPAETGADLLARIRAERQKSASARKRRAVDPGTCDQASLPVLPEGWVWVPFADLIDTLRNGTALVPVKHETNYPILRISAVRPFAVDSKDIRFLDEGAATAVAEFQVCPGDLLLTRYNGSRHLVGICGIFNGERPVYYPDKLIRVRLSLKIAELSPFFQLAINSGVTRKFIDSEIKTTAGQHGISGGSLMRAPVPLPPVKEAEVIIDRVNEALEVELDCRKELADARALSRSQRQSILKAAFEGRLVAQDPADEPAAALLARLRKAGAPVGTARRRRGRGAAPQLPLFAARDEGGSADPAGGA